MSVNQSSRPSLPRSVRPGHAHLIHGTGRSDVRRDQQRRTTTGVVLAALLLLTGCSGSSEKDAEKIREAIIDDAPGVEDAMVRYSTDVFVNNLSIRLEGRALDTSLGLENDAYRFTLSVPTHELAQRYGPQVAP